MYLLLSSDFYESSDEHIQGDNSNHSGDNTARTGLVVGSFVSSVLVLLVWIILVLLQTCGVISETNKYVAPSVYVQLSCLSSV